MPGAVVRLFLSKIDLDSAGVEGKRQWLKHRLDETLEPRAV